MVSTKTKTMRERITVVCKLREKVVTVSIYL